MQGEAYQMALKKNQDATDLTAEKLLAAALMVRPAEADMYQLATDEDQAAPVDDKRLPPLSPALQAKLKHRGNPFAQDLATIDKLSRAAHRKMERSQAPAKATKPLKAAFRGFPVVRKDRLLVEIDVAVQTMGVNPKTYFHDLARRLRIPLFDSPENLDLEALSRVCRLVRRDAAGE